MSEQITFNRNDWTGKNANLTADGDKFVLNGLDSKLAHWRMTTTKDDLIKMVNQKTGIAYLGFQNFQSKWFSFRAGTVSREDKNPMVAFAQLMWNLV